MDPIGRDKMMHFLSSAMTVAGARHNVISSNIVNVDTPGYKAKDFSFESVMSDLLNRYENNDGSSLGGIDSGIREDLPIRETTDVVWQRFDGNNVDLEREMGKLNEVTGKFKLASRLFYMKYKLMRDQIAR